MKQFEVIIRYWCHRTGESWTDLEKVSAKNKDDVYEMFPTIEDGLGFTVREIEYVF